MTARLRSLVAVAILLALAAHPLAHPLLKECPCIHDTAAIGVENNSFVLAPAHDRSPAPVVTASQAPPIGIGASRAPPAA